LSRRRKDVLAAALKRVWLGSTFQLSGILRQNFHQTFLHDQAPRRPSSPILYEEPQILELLWWVPSREVRVYQDANRTPEDYWHKYHPRNNDLGHSNSSANSTKVRKTYCSDRSFGIGMKSGTDRTLVW